MDPARVKTRESLRILVAAMHEGDEVATGAYACFFESVKDPSLVIDVPAVRQRLLSLQLIGEDGKVPQITRDTYVSQRKESVEMLAKHFAAHGVDSLGVTPEGTTYTKASPTKLADVKLDEKQLAGIVGAPTSEKRHEVIYQSVQKVLNVLRGNAYRGDLKSNAALLIFNDSLKDPTYAVPAGTARDYLVQLMLIEASTGKVHEATRAAFEAVEAPRASGGPRHDYYKAPEVRSKAPESKIKDLRDTKETQLEKALREMHRCACCKAAVSTYRWCGRCKVAAYCDEKCYKKDAETHKATCKEMPKEDVRNMMLSRCMAMLVKDVYESNCKEYLDKIFCDNEERSRIVFLYTGEAKVKRTSLKIQMSKALDEFVERWSGVTQETMQRSMAKEQLALQKHGMCVRAEDYKILKGFAPLPSVAYASCYAQCKRRGQGGLTTIPVSSIV